MFNIHKYQNPQKKEEALSSFRYDTILLDNDQCQYLDYLQQPLQGSSHSDSDEEEYSTKKKQPPRLNETAITQTNQKKHDYYQQDRVEHEYTQHNLIIDSSLRSTNTLNGHLRSYPNPNNYSVYFDVANDGDVTESFRNVVSIQLVDGHLPASVLDGTNTNEGTLAYPYLTLSIPELFPTYAGNNQSLSNMFAVLNPEAKGGAPYARLKTVTAAMNYYKYPIAKLDKMTIQIKKPNGDMYNFGTDGTGPANLLINHSLIFKIITKTKKDRSHIAEPIIT